VSAPFGRGRPDLRAIRAAELDRLADESGDARYRRAAGVLRGKPGGRPPCDDGAALGLAESLEAAGIARSRRDACMRAARLHATTRAEVAPMAERLRKKLGRK
jgi:hypothetical protein